jgi:hypothetical protein
MIVVMEFQTLHSAVIPCRTKNLSHILTHDSCNWTTVIYYDTEVEKLIFCQGTVSCGVQLNIWNKMGVSY